MMRPPSLLVGAVPSPLASIIERIASRFPDSWLVGGAVRELLSNRRPTDFDLAVCGDPVELMRHEANRAGLGFVLLDDTRRIARIVVKESRLTLDAAPMDGGRIDTDLLRRDFTVNAIALGLHDGALFDPLGGVADQAARRLRPVSDTIFHDDPARLLRLYRLMATHGFRPDDDARRLARASADRIDTVAAERQWQELARLFAVPSYDAVSMMAEDGILDRLFPALATGRGVTQNEWHHLNVYDHSLEAMKRLEDIVADPSPLGLWRERLDDYLNGEIGHLLPRSVPLRLAALLHDIGKPTCRTEEGLKVRFLKHDEVGASLAADALRKRGAPNEVSRRVDTLVRHHLRPLNGLHEGRLTRRAAWRYRRAMGELTQEGILLAWADALATNGPKVTSERRDNEREVLRALLEEDKASPEQPRLLDGKEVMRLTGLPEGNVIGQIMFGLEEAVGIGEVTTRDEAVRWVTKRATKY